MLTLSESPELVSFFCYGVFVLSGQRKIHHSALTSGEQALRDDLINGCEGYCTSNRLYRWLWTSESGLGDLCMETEN